MRNILVLVVALYLVLLICRWPDNNANKSADYDNGITGTSFTLISSGNRLSIYKENKTDVMYVVYHTGYKGGLTVMLDTDGNPLTYGNWKNK